MLLIGVVCCCSLCGVCGVLCGVCCSLLVVLFIDVCGLLRLCVVGCCFRLFVVR